MPTKRIDRRLATAVRILLAIAFLLPAVTLGAGLLTGGPWGGVWVGAGFPMWGVLTPGWVWLVPLLVQFLLLVSVVALGYLVVWALVDRETPE